MWTRDRPIFWPGHPPKTAPVCADPNILPRFWGLGGVGIGAAEGVPMDAFFFSMKRAHLGWERFGRKVLKQDSLTPARFDLLSTIVDCEANEELMTQAELWKRL